MWLPKQPFLICLIFFFQSTAQGLRSGRRRSVARLAGLLLGRVQNETVHRVSWPRHLQLLLDGDIILARDDKGLRDVPETAGADPEGRSYVASQSLRGLHPQTDNRGARIETEADKLERSSLSAVGHSRSAKRPRQGARLATQAYTGRQSGRKQASVQSRTRPIPQTRSHTQTRARKRNSEFSYETLDLERDRDNLRLETMYIINNINY